MEKLFEIKEEEVRGIQMGNSWQTWN